MLECKIKKTFKNFYLDTDFVMEDSRLGLLGPSGSGKSLTLKAIAGLIKPDSGKIILNGRTLFDSEKKINLKAQERRVGFLFQDYALFPNFTVEENVRTGLRDKNIVDIEEKLNDMRIFHIKDKYPDQISGGERQRTALCRILVNNPEILLLDEPFSALDEYLRSEIEEEVMNFIDTYKLKTILVSHNKEEVYRICESIVSISSGKTNCIKDKSEFFENPTNITESKLIGIKNFSTFVIKDNEIFLKAWGISIRTSRKFDGDIIGIKDKVFRLSNGPLTDDSIKIETYRLIENINSFIIVYNKDNKIYEDLKIEISKEAYNKLKDGPIFLTISEEALICLKEG
ncbi:ATP-binding cassette domain-containing protein [Anaerococcus sp. NML200537]|uniref:sulfate/molybdate ABC transporter ATP-binding protein n=1 Tax=Anaerococcus sp. NML200537 TaxID=2954485 RepID=UPI0022372E4D|nr:ATP-binding cassette domain-containing protein [Anaerococcus sp. NML200537]MCW6700838.1 ATP-binding cassette domain-containing protein [Anaerococcus sp. NML200537]